MIPGNVGMVKFVNRTVGATPCGCPAPVGCPMPAVCEPRSLLGQARGPAPTTGNRASTAAAAGLYVHVPFCRSKCRYCGFYSVPAAGRDTGRLVAAMLRELDRYEGAEFCTAYVGGGSPTALPAEQLLALVRRIAGGGRRVEEFTVECNPGQVDAELLAGLRRAGANRLSFGAQSFRAAELELLGRAAYGRGDRPGRGVGESRRGSTISVWT